MASHRRSEQDLSSREFFGLSMADLALARSLFHTQLMNYENVIGTALGRYLVRVHDDWPASHDDANRLLAPVRKQKPARTLDNSEIRPYSWPCVLVFVRTWIEYSDVAKDAERSSVLLPKQLWLPDGRIVPICVVEAKPQPLDEVPLERLFFPASFFGPGYPIRSEQQGRVRFGTLGPLVSDGQRVYALTSRHVLGPAGTAVDTFVHGAETTVGSCAGLALTRVPLADAYPEFPLEGAFLNVDVGLVDLAEVDRWTSVAYGLGRLTPPADGRSSSLSLSMIGRDVVSHGAAGGAQRGQVKGLLYRYKAIGGAEHFTDFLIGSSEPGVPLTTRPGDSGSLWCLPPEPARPGGRPDPGGAEAFTPLALQWGGQSLESSSGQTAPYVLASSVATICRMLDLDVVWDWQATLNRYWGAVGHYTIALRAIDVLPDGPLKTLLAGNALNITFKRDDINEKKLTGLSKLFVPLADVPDLAWKIGKGQRGPRSTNPERPNHFADMDQPDSHGQTLLDICQDPDAALDPHRWRDYYSDPKIDQTDPMHQGLLPFRVWQIFDGMVSALNRHSVIDFVCAAGVLAHYIGDACQPLHISSYADGDPSQQEIRTVVKDGKTTTESVPRGQGVHTSYEDDMINRHIGDIFAGLQSTDIEPAPGIANGADAAWATIALMRATHGTIAPPQLVDAYVATAGKPPSQRADDLWAVYEGPTIAVMAAGVKRWRASGSRPGTAPIRPP